MKSITADIKGLLIQSKISKKAGYKRANSFCPLRESKESVRDDGSVFINDICYSEKYPNSFFDVFYPQGNLLLRVIHFPECFCLQNLSPVE